MDRAKKKSRGRGRRGAREVPARRIADVGERFQQGVRNRPGSSSASARSTPGNRRASATRSTSAQMQDGYAKVRKDVDYMVDDVNDFVRHKPGTSILIAAGAGFLLGLLFRPRRYNG